MRDYHGEPIRVIVIIVGERRLPTLDEGEDERIVRRGFTRSLLTRYVPTLFLSIP